jgi:anaerobic ribonucleoside-triphosphate reductase
LFMAADVSTYNIHCISIKCPRLSMAANVSTYNIFK